MDDQQRETPGRRPDRRRRRGGSGQPRPADGAAGAPRPPEGGSTPPERGRPPAEGKNGDRPPGRGDERGVPRQPPTSGPAERAPKADEPSRRTRPADPSRAGGQERPRQASKGAPPKGGRVEEAPAGIRGPRGKLRVIPLGGVGEIGKNMTLVEYEDDVVLLDCGAKFPEEEQRGIDLIVPDVRYVQERRNNLRAILVTHGHEDHIGGLPYVLPQLVAKGRKLPIYGAPLALGFIEGKLIEHRLDKLVDLRPITGGERVQLGKLAAEFIHVTHSIPDTNAIAIHSPVGTILDTADFKFDPTPVMGMPTDERRLRRLGDAGVLALFSDTVRVENAGSTPSEKVVLDTIDEVVRTAKGQVLIATFASNISRLHMAIKAAERYGRIVATAGRSMEQNARVALGLGYLDPSPGLLRPLDEVLRMPKDRRLLVITGSQGEAAAALGRIAAGDHAKIRIGAADVVIVSATPVPGNEETVARTIDNLFRRGASVVYSGVERGVHVSGHAGRDELRRMIDLVRPRYAIPIHGEYRHMVLYRELCNAAGIPSQRVLLPEIGGVIEFAKDSAVQKGRVKAGSLLVDRIGERGTGHVVLRDRENLTNDGVVVVTIVVDRESGALIAGPHVVARGLKPELNDGALAEAERELRKVLERQSKGEPQYGYLVERAKEAVGRSLLRRSKSRPMILPIVTEL